MDGEKLNRGKEYLKTVGQISGREASMEIVRVLI